MREIPVERITDAVAEMCVSCNCLIGPDIKAALSAAEKREDNTLGRQVIETILKNSEIAADRMIPICQDTGLTVVFVEIGQDVHLTGGSLEEAVNAGVARGYIGGCLRKSVVRDPLNRENTGDNTPAVIHYQVRPGDQLKLTVAPKGFGSENMSALKMLKPSQGLEGIRRFVLDTVIDGGPNPCPPIIVGVGVGGTMEKAALLAKQSLLRPLGPPNPDPAWARIEDELLAEINRLDIGPAGFGGRTTALAVPISPYATHIAGLPVAVNIGCHVTRHAEKIL